VESNGYVSEVYRSFGQSILPGQDGILVLKYDASKRGEFGQLKDRVMISTNDSIESKKMVYYSVNIREDFSKLTKKQLKTVPVANFSATELDFDHVQKNAQEKRTIVVTNKGKDPLILRATQSSNGMFKVASDIKEVPAGGKANVIVTFRASTRAGNQQGTVEIITNDPNNPIQVINVKAQIL
jgi:hypothetical protein